ncbi:Uncharacterized conserved protein YjiS, DUF1127 family [Paracoccus solventivorans]|uniref:Uncharacterized conserved protein YjiS, DUF1127 family n=1 Tax=Paracoccus solventivorans TaxID=53463 RepID=A0A1M7IDQ1_9RHOB|nr:DUF1127 domain-containing protein [Paracoccus solventivorans]SHM38891.1 Uncharacterized conserved protein YjiS, DUF1127 family [Paracoccus solventivorans]HMM09411.1 DUF1127 domain-containing protein [Paracoccus solventivorans]
MSAIDTIRVIPANRPAGIIENIAATLRYWADVRATRNELNRLTDRELRDIGLTRGDIERVARGL